MASGKSLAAHTFFCGRMMQKPMMNKICLLLLLTMTSVFAAEPSPATRDFKNKKARYSVAYPSDWNIQELEGGNVVIIASPDGKASFTVTVGEIRRGRPACEFLAERDAAFEPKRVNLLPEDKRPITAAEKKFMAVDDGCLATYQSEVDAKEIIQGVGVYAKRGQVWIVEQKLPLAEHARFGNALSGIARSFKTY